MFNFSLFTRHSKLAMAQKGTTQSERSRRSKVDKYRIAWQEGARKPDKARIQALWLQKKTHLVSARQHEALVGQRRIEDNPASSRRRY